MSSREGTKLGFYNKSLTDFRLFLESLPLSDVAHKPATKNIQSKRNQFSKNETQKCSL